MSLRQGVDLLELINDPTLTLNRVLNIFESLLVDMQAVRLSVDYGESGNFYDKLQEIKKGGTIVNVQPHAGNVKTDKLNYIQPTEQGYPGLLPPVG